MAALQWFVDAKAAAFIRVVVRQLVEESYFTMRYVTRLASCFEISHSLIAAFLLIVGIGLFGALTALLAAWVMRDDSATAKRTS